LAYLPAASPELLARLLRQPPAPADRLPKVLDLHAGGRARRYALGALASEHDQLAGTPEGSRNATLNRAAYALGGYVARGVLLVEEVEMTLLAAAAQCGLPACEARRTLKSGLQAGLRAPRPLPATEQREEVA
ncbi:MAG TPA: hypothetical protein VF171_06885, partial [Trueperaceae bacterium]